MHILPCVHAKSFQSCATLCDPMDYRPPGSSVQAKVLEQVAIPFSRGSSLSRDRTCVSYVSCIGRELLYCEHHQGSPYIDYISILFYFFLKKKRGGLWGQKAGLRPDYLLGLWTYLRVSASPIDWLGNARSATFLGYYED